MDAHELRLSALILTQYRRDELGTRRAGGHRLRDNLKRALILLAAHAGVGDEAIAACVGVDGSTLYRPKRRFVRAT